MAPRISGEQFVAAVQRSGLIEEKRLRRLLKSLRDQQVDPSDAQALAQELVSSGVLTRWQAEKLLQGRSRGFFLGKYRLLLLLGKGGMSAVYLAEHTVMRRRCAVKVLPSKRVHDSSSHLGRFHREAQAVASLDHPNIVRAYDVDKQIEGDVEINFLVMEYVDGPSLHSLVARQGPLSFADAADMARQAALGLAHAHQAGMVHRDVKPSNLLLAPHGVVKVLDLGLARFFDDSGDDALTIQHEEKVLGTADYLAPEQAIDSHSVDARADIYGLGCTLYFLLTGQPPFTEGSLAQRLMAHQTKEPPPLRQFRPDAPESLVQVVARLMAKQARHRYQTADEAASALRQWLVDHADAEWLRRHPELASAAPSAGEPVAPRSTEAAGPTGHGGDPAAASTRPLEPELEAFFSSLDSPAAFEPASGAASPPSPAVAALPQERLVTDNTDSDISEDTITAAVRGLAVTSPARAAGAAAAGPGDRPRKAHPPAFHPRTIQIALAAGLVVLLMAAALGLSALNGTGTPVEEKPVAVQTGWSHREITVGPGADYETITDALEDARRSFQPAHAADVLTVRIDASVVYPERIVIDNSDLSWPEGIELVAVGDQKVALRPGGPEPVVSLHGIPRFSMRGFDVATDGRATAVEIVGWVVGTRLEDMIVRGIVDKGIALIGASGLTGSGASSQVQLRSIVLEGTAPAAVGLSVESGDRAPTGIVVEQCRFVGTLDAGVLVTATAPESLAVRRSIFASGGDGARFEGRGPWSDFQFVGNTFFELERGIVFMNMPDPSSRDFRFEHNLFVGLKGSEVLVARDYSKKAFVAMIAEGACRRNWSDRAAPQETVPGEFDLFAIDGRRGATGLRFVTRDQADPRFLEPVPNSPLRARGSEDEPQIGAVPPSSAR